MCIRDSQLRLDMKLSFNVSVVVAEGVWVIVFIVSILHTNQFQLELFKLTVTVHGLAVG